MKNIVWIVCEDIMQGHPESKVIFYGHRRQNQCSELTEKDQEFINSCQTCIKSKPTAKEHWQPPLQKTYDRRKGPEDLLQVGRVGPLPPSNGSTTNPTAVHVFPRYVFVIPLRPPMHRPSWKVWSRFSQDKHTSRTPSWRSKQQLALPK